MRYIVTKDFSEWHKGDIFENEGDTKRYYKYGHLVWEHEDVILALPDIFRPFAIPARTTAAREDFRKTMDYEDTTLEEFSTAILRYLPMITAHEINTFVDDNRESLKLLPESTITVWLDRKGIYKK